MKWIRQALTDEVDQTSTDSCKYF